MSNSNDNDNLVLEEACRVVDRAYRRIRVDRQYRRLRTALRKLGITQIVGDSWVSIDEESVEIRFGSVPKHRFAMLVEHLVEDHDVFHANRSPYSHQDRLYLYHKGQ